MAANHIPPLTWTCPTCGANVPAGQLTCSNCAGAGNPPPAPAPRLQRAPATPPPPQAHGGNVQYQQRLTSVQVSRNENLINHNWYRFLLWMLRIGGAAALLWLFYGGFLLGWHANPCKPPCTAVVAATVPVPSVPAPPPVLPAVSIAVSQPAAPAPPPLDLSPVDRKSVV